MTLDFYLKEGKKEIDDVRFLSESVEELLEGSDVKTLYKLLKKDNKEEIANKMKKAKKELENLISKEPSKAEKINVIKQNILDVEKDVKEYDKLKKEALKNIDKKDELATKESVIKLKKMSKKIKSGISKIGRKSTISIVGKTMIASYAIRALLGAITATILMNVS